MAGVCGELRSDAPSLEIGTKKCLRTRKTISIKCFNVNPKTGRPYGSCVVCMPKNRAQHTTYGATANGQTKRKIQNEKESIKQMKTDYRHSKEGKTKTKEYTDTPEYRAKCRAFSKTDAGKAIRKRTYKNHKRSTDLMNAFARIIRGGDSPTAITASGFTASMAVRNHFRRLTKGTSMSLKNYGSVWGVDHKIPRSAYDHDDKQDVKRCWSAANMRPLTDKENKDKWTRLIKPIIEEVPVELWPKRWGGVLPQECEE